jgi:hypothetical protein
MKQHPHRQILEKLDNKNAIKPKIGGPPWQFFLKPLAPPPGILAKTSSTPPGFSTRVHLCLRFNNVSYIMKNNLILKY